MLEIKNVSKKYDTRRFGRKTSVKAVTGLSMEIRNGRCIGLVGESGCGKSTLGRMICGLEQPDSGCVLLDGTDIYKGSAKRSLEIKKRVQVVFQDSFSSVDPRMNAQAIIKEPLVNFGCAKKGALDDRVSALLKMVCLQDSDKKKFPCQFSGGQLQRVCIARAFAADPSYIVLDEPLSSLDVSVQAQMLNLLSDVKKSTGVSFLLISHDLEAVYYLSDEIYVMYSGLIMESITDIGDFYDIIHPYSLRLLRLNGKAGSGDEVAAESLGKRPPENGCPYYPQCKRHTGLCRNELPGLKTVSPGHSIRCFNYDRRSDG